MGTGKPSFTIGMEEEYLLVDLETRSVVSDPPREIFEQCATLIDGGEHVSRRMKRRRLSARGVLAGVFFLLVCHAQAEDATDKQIRAVESGLLPGFVIHGRPLRLMRLDDRMRHHGVPGVSIAVVGDSSIAWARGFGVANARSGEPVTAETLFQAASVSKPVAAMAALRLVEEGLAELDQDVNERLKTWTVPNGDYTRDSKVTLRRLLTHTAGLNATGFTGYDVGTKLPTVAQVLDGEPPANSVPVRVSAVPGTVWSYSGGGYIVMQLLLQDISGKTFPQLVKTTVFDKLEMARSTFEQPLPARLEKAAATGHSADGEPVSGGWRVYPELAAAGLWTTPSDLSRLIIALQRSLSGLGESALSEETARSMILPQQAGWGLGFQVGTTGAANWFTHTGHNEGFTCYLFAYAESGEGAVVMTNSDHSDELVLEILRGIAHVYGWPDFQLDEITARVVDPLVYDFYSGEYVPVNFDGPSIVVRRDGERLLGKFFGEWLEMLPESERDYVVPGKEMAISFPEHADHGAQEIDLTLPEVPFFILKARRVE